MGGSEENLEVGSLFFFFFFSGRDGGFDGPDIQTARSAMERRLKRGVQMPSQIRKGGGGGGLARSSEEFVVT